MIKFTIFVSLISTGLSYQYMYKHIYIYVCMCVCLVRSCAYKSDL